MNREKLIELLDYYNKFKYYSQVNFETFVGRVEKDYDMWKSLTTKRISRRCTKEYQKWLKIAEWNGIDEDTFTGRITVSKMEHYEAATKEFLKKYIPVKYTIQAYQNNIPDRTFRHRVIALNWSLERASTEPVHTKYKGKKKEKEKMKVPKAIKKIPEEVIVNDEIVRVKKQLEFYTKNNLPIPKKYIKKGKELGILVA